MTTPRAIGAIELSSIGIGYQIEDEMLKAASVNVLTVAEHELGHVLGLGDLDASVDDLMSGVLGAGIRRNVSHVDADSRVLV